MRTRRLRGERENRAREDKPGQPRYHHDGHRDAGDGRPRDSDGNPQDPSEASGHHVQLAHRAGSRGDAQGPEPRRDRLRHKAERREPRGVPSAGPRTAASEAARFRHSPGGGAAALPAARRPKQRARDPRRAGRHRRDRLLDRRTQRADRGVREVPRGARSARRGRPAHAPRVHPPAGRSIARPEQPLCTRSRGRRGARPGRDSGSPRATTT